MAKELPRTINLLESSVLPLTTWDKIYNWIFAVGRYLIVLVEVVVLMAFVTRFKYDRENNDLIDSINAKVKLLKEQRDFEREVRGVQTTFDNVSLLLDDHSVMSSKVDDVLDNIPSAVVIESYSMSRTSVVLECVAPSYADVEKFEDNFKSSNNYSDVSVSLSRSGTDQEINFYAQITLAQDLDVQAE